MYVYCIPQFTMYDILCTQQASPYRQGDVYSITKAIKAYLRPQEEC